MLLARAVTPACLALSMALQAALSAIPARADPPEYRDPAPLSAPGVSPKLEEDVVQTRRFRVLAALLIALSARTATTISPSIIGPQSITLVGHLPSDEVNAYSDKR
jgi:hypothetical protein